MAKKNFLLQFVMGQINILTGLITYLSNMFIRDTVITESWLGWAENNKHFVRISTDRNERNHLLWETTFMKSRLNQLSVKCCIKNLIHAPISLKSSQNTVWIISHSNIVFRISCKWASPLSDYLQKNPVWISCQSNTVLRISSKMPSPLSDLLCKILFESVFS